MRKLTEGLCGNRLPISGECMMGCGGWGECKQGHERPLPPRDLYNPLKAYPPAGRAALEKGE